MYLRDGLPYKLPEIFRDETITDGRKREIDFYYRLKERYGDSRHASFEKLREAAK